MWDRRRYKDTDFGLEENEPFEPIDAEDQDDIDLSQPHVMTVLGPIPPDQLGICQHLEHILCDPGAVTEHQPDVRLDRIDLACEELEAFFTVGGRAMVDATTRDYGRNARGLRAIAQRVPVHIIAVTGRYVDPYASQLPNALDAGAIEQELISEIASGIDDTSIRPGLIAFGTSLDDVTAIEETAIKAAARAAVATGLPVITHTTAGTMAHEQLDLVERLGLFPDRVVVGRLDGRLELNYLKSVAARGAWVSFDQVGKRDFGEDKPKAEMLIQLAESGFENQVLVSQDLARSSDLVSYGGSPGWIHLLERFTLELMGAGATSGFVRKLLIDNPARALAIRP